MTLTMLWVAALATAALGAAALAKAAAAAKALRPVRVPARRR